MLIYFSILAKWQLVHYRSERKLMDKRDQAPSFFIVSQIRITKLTDQCCFFYPDTHQEYRYHCNKNNEQAVPVI